MAVNVEKIIALAKTSDAARYNWKDRGRAPIAYIAGMSVAYVDAVHSLDAGDRYVVAIAAQITPTNENDVLNWYSDLLDGAGLLRQTPADRLLAVFAILLGLGMRESSGQHCEGRDMAANNVDAVTAEAGLFQVSYNSINLHPLLAPLFDHHGGRGDLLPIFSDGVRCKPNAWADWGEGKGREFQTLMKRNPRFATLYSGILLRCGRRHWGPLKTKKAEVRPEAVELFRAAMATSD